MHHKDKAVTLSHICYRSVLLNVFLVAWGLMQAKVLPSHHGQRAAGSGSPFHGEALGEREKLERGPKARPLGKWTCGSCRGKERAALGGGTPSLLPVLLQGIHQHLPPCRQQGPCCFPAPAANCLSMHLELAGGARRHLWCWDVVCVILAKKGKMQNPELYTHVQLHRTISRV